MGGLSRYNTGDAGLVEQGVLKNKLNIIDSQVLSDIETILLNDSYDFFINRLQNKGLVFYVKLVFDIHKFFLGTLYSWAGSIRKVNISKGESFFVPSVYIPNALDYFEGILKKNMPIKGDNKSIVVKKIALIACEFNVIHPFREGNGRTIRLFIDLLLLSIGYKVADYSQVSVRNYIEASIAGMNKDYKPMEKVLRKVLSIQKTR